MPKLPEGWYPDPHDPSRELYFDGSGWSGQGRSAQPEPRESSGDMEASRTVPTKSAAPVDAAIDAMPSARTPPSGIEPPKPAPADLGAGAWMIKTATWLKSDRRPAWLNRRNAIIASAVVVFLVVAASVTTTVVQNAITEQRLAASEQRRLADLAEAEKERATEAVAMGESLIEKGVALLATSADFAEPADLEDLELAIDRLRKALRDDDTDAIEDEADDVTRIMRAIGDRPVPYTFAYSCRDAAGATLRFASWEESWASAAKNCDATKSGGDSWPPEAIAAAQAGGLEDARLPIYYGMCATPGLNPYGDGTLSVLSASQAVEAGAVLLLCPSHPAAGNVQAAIAAAGAAQQQAAELEGRKADGTAFGPGLHVIGQPVQPGTYVSEGSFEGCYWERTDAAGEIIDNNFAINAARIEVTIESGDFSFTSERCGTFLRVG